MPAFRFPEKEPTVALPEASRIVNRLLENRNITSETAEAFLAPQYDTGLHDPMLLNDADRAIKRIIAAMEQNEKIAIFSDYDCDGIPGAVILHDYFKAVGYSNFVNYIPHRHFEGFGLSTEAIDKLSADNVTLVITIDCGTTDIDPVAYAKGKGVDIIITDHHEPGEVLPDAVAVVNPKLGGYPFSELCGAAVVFKLVQLLLANTTHELALGWEKWWLDMVGIATVADMVPLVGENRVLAHYGLKVLRQSRRPGLQQLFKKNRVDQQYLTEEDIGFTVGPRINAASRMDTPEDAFNLLSATDEASAGQYVEHLEKLNKERKTAVSLITRELHKRLGNLEVIPDVIVLGSPEWRPSLVGIAANKIAQEHQRPVFLWGRDGNGVLKGSCRSGGGISVVKLMEAARHAFVEHGGHHFSGGFSVKEEEIFALSETLNQAFTTIGNNATIAEELLIDETLALEEVTNELIQDLQRLAPYGTGNPKPLFAFRNVTPRKVEQFGKTKEHLKLLFETTNNQLEAIAFFSSPDSFSKIPSADTPHTLIAHIERSFFMGRQQTRLRIVDII